MHIVAGTSGYSYAAWKGSFYPADAPAARMLGAYAARLPAVEINATFYRMPRPSTLATWAGEVPDGFVFALKGPQRITHFLRLRDAAEPLGFFTRAAAELGPKLGPVLWQLPPNMKKDAGRLRDFLALLPRGSRAAFEFRHESWLDDETFGLLADAGVALCVTDGEERTTPPVATARFGYLRLRRPDYADADLARWRDRIAAQPWSEAFAFFKHEDEARGPAFALRFLALAGEAAAEAQAPRGG
jgi:uncharacterized protein YecE (DUF72 family)